MPLQRPAVADVHVRQVSACLELLWLTPPPCMPLQTCLASSSRNISKTEHCRSVMFDASLFPEIP
ncbi:MAG: hypothetical protein AAF403_02620 [Pseudomonadota bacterium]